MPSDFPRFTAAVVQATPSFLDWQAGLAKACRLMKEAGERGARLIAFPEAWFPGYPFWHDCHDVPLWRRLFHNSISVPGPAVEALSEAVNAAGAYVVIGVSERDGGTLYDTLLYFDPQGRLLGKHRKLLPTHEERTYWGQGDGSGLLVLKTEIGAFGGLICGEHLMPLARQVLHAKGERVHIAAWPGMPERPCGGVGVGDFTDLMSRHYAVEGRCFVLLAGMYASRATLAEAFGGKDLLGWVSAEGIVGGSAIIGPQGNYIAGPLFSLAKKGSSTAKWTSTVSPRH